MRLGKVPIFVIIFLLASNPASSESTQGVVVYIQPGCDYYIVEYEFSGNYALLEWYGGSTPSKGDQITGEFTYGTHDFYVLNRRAYTRAYVEDILESAGSVWEKFKEHTR